MNKITYSNGVRQYNTYCETVDNLTVIRHHTTDIVVHDHNTNTLTINSGGWYSKTTKDRINQYLTHIQANFFITQKNRQWFVVEQSSGKLLTYADGLVLQSGVDITI